MSILVPVFWCTYEIRICGWRVHIYLALIFEGDCSILHSHLQCGTYRERYTRNSNVWEFQLFHIIGIIIISLLNFNHSSGCIVVHLHLFCIPLMTNDAANISSYGQWNNSFSHRAGMNKTEISDISHVTQQVQSWQFIPEKWKLVFTQMPLDECS